MRRFDALYEARKLDVDDVEVRQVSLIIMFFLDQRRQHARRWSVAEVASAEELARRLTAQTWVLCAAFRVAGTPYVFLNDATSEAGAQEYAALKVLGEGRYVQAERITFSWCAEERAPEHIRAVNGGEYDRDAGRELVLSVQESRPHGRCAHCA